MIGLVFALVAVMLIRGYAVPILCAVFVLGPPIRYGIVQLRHRRSTKEPIF